MVRCVRAIRRCRRSAARRYTANKRDLPWRRQAGGNAAYGVWVSEIMLQQTRVATVIEYWNRWMAKWPSLPELAASSIDDVNAMWSGLGYYRRARMLLEVISRTLPDCLSCPHAAPMLCAGSAVRCCQSRRLAARHGCVPAAPLDVCPSPPAAVSDLLKVPGIGPYTAGAIASIAFGQTAAIVDGSPPRPHFYLRRFVRL